jgi:2-succinyl-5-enolpyruvyl-6-hydroxy-3-cyclohexene-1-carboxylate synthase
MISNIPLAQAIVQHFKKHQIDHIVISPGSRNAPLTISFANDNYFKCFSIADERSAAFFGLGLAQQLRRPVALLCTSGSALLNYYPAIAEAFYSQIPLIVVSADRPSGKIDIGDGQTIRQDQVFANHILCSETLNDEDGEHNDRQIHHAIEACLLKRGPVHINVPFEEPLYNTTAHSNINPYIFEVFSQDEPFEVDINFLETWQQASKKLILVGDLFPHALDEGILNQLLQDESIIILSEKSSNLHHAKLIDQIDVLITPFTDEDFRAFQPEVLLTFGGMIVSKRIKAFLRKYKPARHVHVDSLRAYDTFFCLSQHYKTMPNVFFNQILKKTQTTPSNYQSTFLTIFQKRKQLAKAFVEKQIFSDLTVFDTVFKYLPENLQIQVGNSSPIRYFQLFETKKSWDIFCNRGTSGIDGSTSTAVGAAFIAKKPTVLITGDISFFYDNNGLWNNYIKSNFGIILINNRGGGIFRILPGHQDNYVFNEFFETQHELNASHLAAMHGFDYLEASNQEIFKNHLKSIYSHVTERKKPFILEIFTPTLENDKILKQFFKNL